MRDSRCSNNRRQWETCSNSMALKKETVRYSQQSWENLRDSQKLHGTGYTVGDSFQPYEKVRDMQQLHGSWETVRDSQQAWETVRDM